MAYFSIFRVIWTRVCGVSGDVQVVLGLRVPGMLLQIQCCGRSVLEVDRGAVDEGTAVARGASFVVQWS